MENLEVVLDIYALHKQGLSQRAIARKLGLHRDTVKKYVADPQAVRQPPSTNHQGSQADAYDGHIRTWLNEDADYRATWIYDRLQNVGYSGGYDSIRRKVQVIKAERQQLAYLRFETEPGQQAQVDFGDFGVDLADGGKRVYYLFAMILGYSRDLYLELLAGCNLTSFLDCHVRAFRYFGGAPQEILYDRMRNVYLGRLAGRDRFNTSLLSCGLHYGFKPLAAPAHAGWVKGKVERPFDFVREGFWRGYAFSDVVTANKDLTAWQTIKRERIHGTTHEQVSTRFERERPHLQALPTQVFDTSLRLLRPVYKDCAICVAGNRYVVEHGLVGKDVLARVKDNRLRIFDNDRLIVTYDMPTGRGQLVQDPRFYAALRADTAMTARKYARVDGQAKGRAKTISPTASPLELEVERRPLAQYQAAAEQQAVGHCAEMGQP